ncbi:MAG: Hsp33 family molecular chaperone HslO [Caulobacterales bacterium]
MSSVDPGESVAAFQLETAPARGRIARLGASTIDAILRRHAYPRPVALLLGEALALAALIGSLAKFQGRVTLQAEGDGPVRLLVAEYRTDGGLRGYARISDEAAATITAQHALSPAALIGEGALTLTIDQGPDTDQMQGVVPLEGDTLAACAEAYFERSEQTPTRIRLAVVEEVSPGVGGVWMAGGILLQRIAGDVARGDVEEGWRTSVILFDTVTDAELADRALSPDRLLYRLFNEVGVRLAPAGPLSDFCPCDRERLAAVLRGYAADELAGFAEADGLIHARCQFCARVYLLDPNDLAAPLT